MRGKRFSPQLGLRALPPWGPSLPWLCPVDSQVASFPGLVSPAEATASRSRDPGGTGILSVILRSLANGPELRGRGPRASTHLVLFHFDLRGDRNIGAVEEKAGDQRGEGASCLQAALRATLCERGRGRGRAGTLGSQPLPQPDPPAMAPVGHQRATLADSRAFCCSGPLPERSSGELAPSPAHRAGRGAVQARAPTPTVGVLADEAHTAAFSPARVYVPPR